MKPSVVVVGSCNTDLISYTDVLPKPGETSQGNLFTIGFGGKGANQCIVAARLGVEASMVARIGNDYFGENYLKNFKDNGVHCKEVAILEGVSTGVATIVVDSKGENSNIYVPGANLKITAEHVSKAEYLIQNAQVVVCQGEICDEATKQALKLAKKHKVLTLLNAAPASQTMDEEIFSLSDIVCVNETEAATFTGIEVKCLLDAEAACKCLIGKGCSEVILTLGAEGALLMNENGPAHVRALKVDVIDTTGAGDAFMGAMAYFLATSPAMSRVEMIENACVVASVSVQKKGTQTSFPSRKDLEHLLRL